MARIMPDNYYYDVARKNIRKYRIEKKLTQQALADLTELSMHYISEIESENRKKQFSLATLGRIANALEIKIQLMFEED